MRTDGITRRIAPYCGRKYRRRSHRSVGGLRVTVAVLSTCILASMGAMAVVSTDSAFGAAPVNALPVAPALQAQTPTP
jgi:hypothetical protein